MFVYNPNKLSTYKIQYLLKYEKWDAVTLEQFLSDHLTFTDKASYLSWVKSWKEQYNALTVKCRVYKKKVTDWETWYKSEPAGSRSDLYYQARIMLLVRSLGKKRSWEMKQKNMQ